jgi:hypothetical protein
MTAGSEVPGAGTNAYVAMVNYAPTTGQTYTASIFVKPFGGLTTVTMLVSGVTWFADGLNRYVIFNMTGAGSITATFGGSASGTITQWANGWYRLTFTMTPDGASPTAARVQIGRNPLADGTNGWYMWGGQFEAGSSATSYIPTTVAQLTRAAESVVCTDLAKLGYTAAGFSVGVAWEHATCADGTRFPTPLLFSDNALANYVQLYVDNTNKVYARVVAGGVQLANTQVGTAAPNTRHAAAIAFTSAGVNVSVDGAAPVYVAAAVPIALFQRAYLGCFDTNSAQALNGVVARYIDWNRVIANDELINESAVA